MRLNLSIIFILISLQCFAQKSQVQIARNNLGKLQAAIRSNQDTKEQLKILGEGLKAAESASKDKRTKHWAETWAIKAYLTSYMALIADNEQAAEDNYTQAVNLLDTVKTLNKYDEHLDLIDAATLNVIIKKQEKGNKAFMVNDFYNAFNYLKAVSDYFPKDTALAVNAALSAQNIRGYDNALFYFKRAKDDGAKNPAIFQFLANLYTSKFDTEKATQTLEDGLKVNPLNSYLINDYINLLLDNEQYDKASDIISKVLNYDRENKILYFLYGYLQQVKANSTVAEKAYKDAIQLDPNYFPALYQLAITYINEAAAHLKSTSTNRVPDFIAKINQSESILEHAHEINLNDTHTVQLLIEIYSRKNKLDKAQELQKSLEEL